MHVRDSTSDISHLDRRMPSYGSDNSNSKQLMMIWLIMEMILNSVECIFCYLDFSETHVYMCIYTDTDLNVGFSDDLLQQQIQENHMQEFIK